MERVYGKKPVRIGKIRPGETIVYETTCDNILCDDHGMAYIEHLERLANEADALFKLVSSFLKKAEKLLEKSIQEILDMVGGEPSDNG